MLTIISVESRVLEIEEKTRVRLLSRPDSLVIKVSINYAVSAMLFNEEAETRSEASVDNDDQLAHVR